MIRSLKSGERKVCFVGGAGEHSIDDSDRNGYSNVKEALEKNNYKTRTMSTCCGARARRRKRAPRSSRWAKDDSAAAAKPKSRGLHDPGGRPARNTNIRKPAVDALKTYVNNGGQRW